MSALDELAQHIRTISSSVSPSVVSIGSDARGSGFVIAPNRIVTNAHNLRDRTVSVRFDDGTTVQAALTGVDPDGDLAVLEVATGDRPALPWSTDEPRVGDVVAGVSRDHTSATVTSGQVSAVARTFRGPRGRRIQGGIEHTAPLRRGSSGGPLVAADGTVVGVNTHRLDAGFYLARSGAEALEQLLGRLAGGESIRRPQLGVAVAPPQVTRKLRRSVGLAEVDGLLVRQVEAGSPAERSGVLIGDVLVSAGETALTTPEALLDALATAGETIELHIVRGVEETTLEVVLTESTTQA